MFKLWFMIKYSKNKKDFKNKLISYLKFMRTYILPTLLMYLFSMCLHPVFTAADHLKLFALYNLIIIFGTHFMLQKFFFTKLEKDVVIKFLPDRIYDYIKVRLIMLLLKWNLPFILTSTLCLRGIFIGSNFIFYLGAILLVTGWFIINYLVALYLRHMKNNIHGIFRIIVNAILCIIALILITVVPVYMSIKFLNHLDAYYKNYNIVSHININIYMIILLISIVVLSMLLLYFTDDYFKINIRKIIINKEINKKFKVNKKIDRYIDYIINIMGRRLSALEKKILKKDIKGLFRENKFTFLALLVLELFIDGFLLYIYYSDIPNTLQKALETFTVLESIMLIFILILFIIGGMVFKDSFDVNNDRELLIKYGIKINRIRLINSKRKLSIIIIFLPITIFYIIAFITIINIWSWLTIVLSFISISIIANLLGLYIVKIKNNANSENNIIKTLNFIIIASCIMVFKFMFEEVVTNLSSIKLIQLYLAFNMLLIISYLFNLKINVNRLKVDKENF